MRVTEKVLNESIADINERLGFEKYSLSGRNGYQVIEDERGEGVHLYTLDKNRELYAYLLGLNDGLVDFRPLFLTPVRRDPGNCRLYCEDQKGNRWVVVDQGDHLQVFDHTRDGEPCSPLKQGIPWSIVTDFNSVMNP